MSKDREEHAIVVEAVAETLGPFCDELTWDPEPSCARRRTSGTSRHGSEARLRDPGPYALDAGGRAASHPAVAGTRPTAALDTIAELEPFDRGCYAGPVGWVDANGDGEWAIALRCAELRGERATLYAGAGIVAAPNPARSSTRPSGSSARSSTRCVGASARRDDPGGARSSAARRAARNPARP